MNTDHFWQKFAEIILLLLTALFVGMAYWATWATHQDFATAMLDNNKLVLGALLGLLTKQAFTARASDSANGDTNGTKTTDTTTTVASTVVSRSELPKTGESSS